MQKMIKLINKFFFLFMLPADGTWTVNFIELYAMGFDCDSESYCDFYVKIFINNDIFYTTDQGNEKLYINFMVDKEKTNIPYTARVRIEVWDHDDFLNGDDDLMKTLDTTIGDIVNQPKHSLNGGDYITVYSTWMNKYNVIENAAKFIE